METQVQVINQGLTPIQVSVIKQMPFSLQKYVKAKDSPIISEMETSVALKFLTDLISTTEVNIGFTIKATDSVGTFNSNRSDLS